MSFSFCLFFFIFSTIYLSLSLLRFFSVYFLDFIQSINLRVRWKVHRPTKILLRNVTKLVLFFNIGPHPCSLHTFQTVLKLLDPVSEKKKKITGRCDVITWTFQPMNFSTHPHIYYHFRYVFLSSVFLIYLFINNIDFSLSLCVVLFLFFNLISTQTYIPIHVHLGLACIHTDTLTLSLSHTHTHTHINICIYEFASSLIFCEVTNLFLPRITHCSNLSRPELKSFSKLIRSTIISEKLFGFFFRWFTYD